MKWDCGETLHERTQRQKEWHRWYAWHPVRVGPGDCRWLEYVERKIEFCWDDYFWEYRAAP